MKWIFLAAFILALFGTLFVCAANILSARKNAQLRANRSFTRWFNFQRLKTGRCHRVLPPPVWSEFSGSGSTDGRAAMSSRDLVDDSQNIRPKSAGNQPSPLPDSLTRKEAMPTPQRASSEAGAHDFDPLAEWKKCNPFPNGRLTPRRSN